MKSSWNRIYFREKPAINQMCSFHILKHNIFFKSYFVITTTIKSICYSKNAYVFRSFKNLFKKSRFNEIFRFTSFYRDKNFGKCSNFFVVFLSLYVQKGVNNILEIIASLMSEYSMNL